MMYILIGICAVSILLNMILASYCQRLSHWANFWKTELKREQMGVRPVEIKRIKTREEIFKEAYENGYIQTEEGG